MTALLLTVLGCSSLVLLPRVQWGGKRGAAQHRCSSFMVSERHNQAYKESIKLYAALEPSSPMPATLELVAHTPIETMYHQGHLVHETVRPLLRPDECQAVVDESEEWADRAGSTVLDYYCALLPSLSSTSSPTRTLLPRKVPHLPPPRPCVTLHSGRMHHTPPPRAELDEQAAGRPSGISTTRPQTSRCRSCLGHSSGSISCASTGSTRCSAKPSMGCSPTLARSGSPMHL